VDAGDDRKVPYPRLFVLPLAEVLRWPCKPMPASLYPFLLRRLPRRVEQPSGGYVMEPIKAIDVLRSIQSHLYGVVRYGKDTTNALDFAHISTALDEVDLLIKAQVSL
jgi:hypothetical protein